MRIQSTGFSGSGRIVTETGNTCANCRTVMPAGAAFCPACGQSVKPLSRPWLEFAREMLDELLDYDGRMLRSLRLLLTRPGFLSAEYIGGRRAAYTPPIRLYLVVSLLFFLVLPLILAFNNPEIFALGILGLSMVPPSWLGFLSLNRKPSPR